MSKNIVILCDGTWNREETKTHIGWLDENLVDQTENQVVHYQRGVGAEDYNRLPGGGLGLGLSRDIRQCYEELIEHYEPGDEVFILGFSRGAYTARSLCGFIQLVGRLRDPDETDEAFLLYRLNLPSDRIKIVERKVKGMSDGPLPVRFLGVFDTVGSLGIPFEIKDRPEDLEDKGLIERVGGRLSEIADGVGDVIRRPITRFHDTELGDRVQEAYHAVAIDERRALFAPTMWTGTPGKAFRLAPDGSTEVEVDQRVEQVWFAGVHGDVGGGYFEHGAETRQTSLSTIPLEWMARRAARAGLKFREGVLQQLADRAPELALAAQNDSFTDQWHKVHKITHKVPLERPVGNAQRRAANAGGGDWTIIEDGPNFRESIHPSVGERLDRTVGVKSEERPTREIVYGEHRPIPRAMIGPADGV